MKLNKYNRGGTSAGTSSPSGPSPSGSSSFSLNRDIWGQHDDGTDIDGDATMQGNIYAVDSDFSTEEEEDSDDNKVLDDSEEKNPLEDIFEEDSGNIWAQNNIKAGKEVQAPDLYATGTIYLPHPDTGEKVDIIELIKQLAQQNDIFGSADQPVVLLSGIIRRYGVEGYYSWGFSGSKLPCVKEVTVQSVQDGLMTVFLRVDTTVCSEMRVTSSHVTQAESNDTMTTSTRIEDDNSGAHWFESRTANAGHTTLYIREFHNTNDSNDAWGSTGWEFSDSPTAINVTCFGWAKKLG